MGQVMSFSSAAHERSSRTEAPLMSAEDPFFLSYVDQGHDIESDSGRGDVDLDGGLIGWLFGKSKRA
jgi:hypothetical protein